LGQPLCFEQCIRFHRKHGLNRQLLSIVEAKVDQNIVSAASPLFRVIVIPFRFDSQLAEDAVAVAPSDEDVYRPDP
jgi:hypothetical protein